MSQKHCGCDAIDPDCWALEQTRYFTLGCDPLIIVVDHKPLVVFLNDKTLDDVANARLFKLKEKMMKWKFTVVYKPGKVNFLTWDLVKNVMKNIKASQKIIAMILSGFPDYKLQLPIALQNYWLKRDDLYVVDGVLMCGKSIVIPKDLSPAILEVLGSAHQGVVAMKARAREAVYWPGLGTDIENFKKNCQT